MSLCKRIVNSIIRALLVVLFTSSGLYAQYLGMDLLRDNKSLEVPFHYVNGLILIDVYYQDLLKLKFIVDTGASNTILFNKEYADMFRTEYTDTLSVYGASLSHGLTGYIARNGLFNVDDKTIVERDYIVIPEGDAGLSESIGMEVHGILGMDFFKRLTLEINYSKKVLTVVHPEKQLNHPNAITLPINVIQGKPYINTTFYLDSTKLSVNLLVDSGANVPLLIHHNITDIAIPDTYVPTYLGSGISGDIFGHIGYSSRLNLGDVQLENPLTYFQNLDTSVVNQGLVIRDGLIGSKVLERFNIVVDFAKNKIHLTKNKNYKKKPKVDRSGMVVHALPKKNRKAYSIQYVLPNGPADKAGLKKGDQILQVNYCRTRFMNLQKLVRKFYKKAGREYKIKVLRNNEKLTFKLTLEDILKKPTSY